jgi:hypothetical protein
VQIDETLLFPPEPEAPNGGRRSSLRPRTSFVDRAAISLVAAAAAVAAAFAPGEPAGWPVADALLQAAVAALVTVAGSRARRSTWLWAAGVATVAAPGLAAAAVGLVAMAIAITAQLLDRRKRLEGAIVLGLAIQVLLRLGDVAFFGGSALLVAVAVVPVLVSAYRVAPRRVRRRVHLAAAGFGVFMVLGLLSFLASAALAAQRVGDGVLDARAGLTAARDGHDSDAAVRLYEAADSFADADEILDSWWARPGRAVPFVGQQARAVAVATEEGHRLAVMAADTATQVPIEDLDFEDGRIDLDLVVAAQQPLADTAAALADSQARLAEIDTRWVLPPIDGRLGDLRRAVDEAAPDAALASELAAIAPGLLGGEGERRYFVVFTTPAESRGLGGFMGNWGELTAVDGKLTLTESGRADDLNDVAREVTPVVSPVVDGEHDQAIQDYLDRYHALGDWTAVQDVTASPDLPTVAAVLRQLYPQMGGQEIDGVLVVDPYALAALMRYSGPVEIEGVDEPLTERNAVDFLLTEQYELFEREEREDLLVDTSEAVFERLTTGNLPNPRIVADHLAPLADEGRLGLVSFHDDEQALFERFAIDAHMPPPGPGDAFSLVTSNGGHNKIDVYQERSVRYDVELDPRTGALSASATIELTNAVPSLDLPQAVVGSNDQGFPVGTNEVLVSVYTPHRLVGGRVDGQPVGFRSNRELGYSVFATLVRIPAGETVVVEMDLEGRMASSASSYELQYLSQPLVNPDEVEVTLQVADGWRVRESEQFERRERSTMAVATPEADQDETLVVGLRRD